MAAPGGEAASALPRLATCLAAKFERQVKRTHVSGVGFFLFSDCFRLSPPAAALIFKLLPLLQHDESARRVLALLLADDASGEALERTARASPALLPALVAVLAADDGAREGAGDGVWAMAAEQALLYGCCARNGLPIAAWSAATPGLLPALVRRLRSPAYRGGRSGPGILAIYVIVHSCPAALAEAEAQGLLLPLVDWLRAAAAVRQCLSGELSAGLLTLGDVLIGSSTEGIASRVAAVGGLAAVVAILKVPRAGERDAAAVVLMLEAGLKVVQDLALDSRERSEWLVAEGLLAPLVRALRHPSDAVAAAAATAVASLVDAFPRQTAPDQAYEVPAALRRLMDAGALPAAAANGGGGRSAGPAAGVGVGGRGAARLLPELAGADAPRRVRGGRAAGADGAAGDAAADPGRLQRRALRLHRFGQHRAVQRRRGAEGGPGRLRRSPAPTDPPAGVAGGGFHRPRHRRHAARPDPQGLHGNDHQPDPP
jgi:hypothetical protein